MDSKKGISAIVAVVLLIAITVVIVDLFALFLSGYFSGKKTGHNPCEYFCAQEKYVYGSYNEYGGSCLCSDCKNFTDNDKNYVSCESREFIIK